jgi:hypothetical protein
VGGWEGGWVGCFGDAVKVLLLALLNGAPHPLPCILMTMARVAWDFTLALVMSRDEILSEFSCLCRILSG